MTRLVCGCLDLVEDAPSVLEFGNQTLKADDDALRAVVDRMRSRPGVDHQGLTALIEAGYEGRGDRAEALYRMLGFSSYGAIDVNDNYGSMEMDLNRDLEESYGFKETFSLVTNNGTSEHIFDQASVFRNMHRAARVGGLMLHLLPSVNYVNHGFYTFQPNLFTALATANGYELIALGLGNRRGDGAIHAFRPEATGFAAMLREARAIDVESLHASAKLTGHGLLRRLGMTMKRLRAPDKPGHKIGRVIEWLQDGHHDVLVFAVMRKIDDAPFRTPIQGLYEDVISNDEIRASYRSQEAEGV